MRFYSFILKNVIRRRVRSSLTVIGMAVAVGAVVALVGISSSSVASFLSIYQQQKIAIIVQQRGAKQRLTSVLSDTLGGEIAKIPGVKQVNPGLVDYMSIEELGINAVVMQGWVADSPIMKSLNILPGGHWIAAADRRAVLLGADLAENFAKDETLKKYGHVGSQIPLFDDGMYTVVGVVKSPNPFESNGMWVVLGDLQRFMGRKGQVTGYSVVIDHPDNKAEVEQVVRHQGVGPQDDRGQGGRGVGHLDHRNPVHPGDLLDHLGHRDHHRRRGHVEYDDRVGLRADARDRHSAGDRLAAAANHSDDPGRIGPVESHRRSGGHSRCGRADAGAGPHPAVAGLIDAHIPDSTIGLGIVMALVVGLLGAAYPAYRGAQLLPTEALRHE